MADRTSNSTFDDPGSNTTIITGIASVADADTIVVPRKIKSIITTSNNDNDAIATATIGSDGFTVTFGLIDDAGSVVAVAANVGFIARRDPQ